MYSWRIKNFYWKLGLMEWERVWLRIGKEQDFIERGVKEGRKKGEKKKEEKELVISLPFLFSLHSH